MTTNLDPNVDDNDDNDHVDNESLTFGFVVINHVTTITQSAIVTNQIHRFHMGRVRSDDICTKGFQSNSKTTKAKVIATAVLPY